MQDDLSKTDQEQPTTEQQPTADQQPQAAPISEAQAGGAQDNAGGVTDPCIVPIADYLKAQVMFAFPLALGVSVLFMGREFSWLFLVLFCVMLCISLLASPFRQKLDIRSRWHSSPLLLGMAVSAIACAGLYAAAYGVIKDAPSAPAVKRLDTMGLTNASAFDFMTAGAEPYMVGMREVFAPRRFTKPQVLFEEEKRTLEGNIFLVDDATLCKFIAGVEPKAGAHPAIGYVLGIWDAYGLHRTAFDAGFGLAPMLTRKQILEGFTKVDRVRRVESEWARGYAVHGTRLNVESEYIFAEGLASRTQMQAWTLGCGLSDKEVALVILGMGARE